MRISAISIPFLLLLALSGTPLPQSMPMMRSVEPAFGKVGDILTVQGENLGPATVAGLYLTDGNTDTKAAIIEQTATSIKFKIPPEAKPGRLALMVLTTDKPPRLLEEPVKITVEPETTAAIRAPAGRGSTNPLI